MKKVSDLRPEYDPVNSLYKIEEGNKKYYLPLKSLESLEKFFDAFIANNKQTNPSVIAWYNSLTRSEQADVLVMNRFHL